PRPCRRARRYGWFERSRPEGRSVLRSREVRTPTPTCASTALDVPRFVTRCRAFTAGTGSWYTATTRGRRTSAAAAIAYWQDQGLARLACRTSGRRVRKAETWVARLRQS